MGDTDPVELMKLHDKIIRMENSVAGLSEDGMGVAKSPSHYVQFVEKESRKKGITCLLQIIILVMSQML